MSTRTLISTTSRRGRVIYWTVLAGTAVVFLLVFFFPLYWMITGAVKHPAELALASPTFVPRSFHPESFVDAWSKLRIAHYFANTVLYANGRLTTNQGLSLRDQDHVSTTVLARALLGRTYAEASFRTVWYFVDADRPDPARRSTVFLSLFQTFWASERQHVVVGATTALHLDRRANELTVYVAWEGSNGRRFTDHTPLEGEDYFFPQRGPDAERGRLVVEP